MTPSRRPNPQKPWLAIGVVVALSIIAVNLAAYVLYRRGQPPVKLVEQPVPKVVDAEPDSAATPIGELAIEQREQGVQALRLGEYARAIARFEAALKLDREVSDAAVLLDVAKRLLDAEAQKDKAGRDAPEPAPRRDTPARRIVRRTPDRRSRSKAKADDRKSTPKPAFLLVSTVPERLLIELDGRPVALSPTRLEVDPGQHAVRLRRGKTVLFNKKIELRAGQTVAIEEYFDEELARASQSAKRTGTDVARDPSLDLLALVDRDRQSPPNPPSELPSSATPAEPPPPRPDGLPGLLVYWPGRMNGDVQRSLGSELKGIDVRVISGANAFRAALRSRPDAVMAAPSVLRENGLAPKLTGARGNAMGGYFAASFKAPVTKEELSRSTLGLVDELGRRRTPIFVARLLGLSEAPTLRRVNKAEDLLPLLQFNIARAVLVREADLQMLRGRTKQRLFTVALQPPNAQLAVAVVDGRRGSAVERALLDMRDATKKALGVDSWTR